ncbi:hypothetical protein E4631_06125 [Hymenobacter sp. UV11]|uniref:hypothetical protein n=1 Tax=Hymenobacter sp. UV11 TaxID=1849735 RepID=UPI00105C8632|nr:hypothetical protein [Hymenobacter sp. UV11]TDN38269.1 hypothetical protein A8B98_25010 [Hymenobacter sp. UV11]TFZ67554.1 hypothetical protein E4631_06125 [Hymenobacter sp. UV11]
MNSPTATAPLLPPLPTLSVTDQGRVYLHAALTTHLGLELAQPANLVAPPTGSPYWHLDLRPAANCFIVSGNNGQRLRISKVQLPFELLSPDEPPLTLYLLPGEPAIPGYYPLLPAAAFDEAYTAFLAEAAVAARRASVTPIPIA